MLLTVIVKPRARENALVQTGKGRFEARVKAPPDKGRANAALIKLLAGHFKVASERVIIIRGASARHKSVEII